MRFLNWLKSLFSKNTQSAPKESAKWDPYWSEVLGRLIHSNLSAFNKAADIESIRKDWFFLSDEQKVQVMQAFFKSLAYYESGYDPKCESVDVGNKYDKETWSVGLLQLSGVDKSNLGLSVGFNYEGLKDPINNLTQGLAIMVNQINKRGKIIIPRSEKGNPGVYWATLNPGNRYDKSEQIIAAAQIKFEVVEKPVEKPIDETPWMTIATKEIGISEIPGAKHHPRIIEYHQATSLKAKDDETSWCSSFVCWVLKQSGYKTTNSAWARDWLKYGDVADKQRGSIIILERNGPGGDSHVGFCTGKETDTHIEVLSGNSGNSVCIKLYNKKDILGFRRPIK